MNKIEKSLSIRCMKVVLWNDEITDNERNFINRMLAPMKRYRGFTPTQLDQVKLQNIIEWRLSPSQINYLRTHNVGSRASWNKRFSGQKGI